MLIVLLKEYLELHQYEISVDLFGTLTSEHIIPIVDRCAAMPLIELCQYYDSGECEALQKRCAFTVACYWKTTPQTERQRLFSLLRNLPSSITVDFLEIVESGSATTERIRNKMEQQATISTGNSFPKPKAMTLQDFCENVPGEGDKKKMLSWRLDPEESYSDWDLRIKYSNDGEIQVYHVHKHILAVGKHKGLFFAENFDSKEAAVGEKGYTTIVLDYEAVSIFPLVLDFIYSGGTELEITNGNSIPLHYVARVLGISTLIETVINFIGKNISLANLVDYIIDAGYFKDCKVMALATQLCAQDITSICVDSEILKNLDREIFEKIVSCDGIERTAKSHVNVLITKYFSLHALEGNGAENLLKCIDVDQIDQLSALTLLKILSSSNNYEGIETFEKMKTICANVMTENWSDFTADNTQREEIFSIFPLLNSNLLTIIFDTVDRKQRTDQMESMALQGQLVNRYREQAAEARRLRQEEVSYLQRELEVRTAKMLSLQKTLEGKLDQVDRALNRRTVRGTAAITRIPSPRESTKPSYILQDEVVTAAITISEQNQKLSPPLERQKDLRGTNKYAETDLDWYQDDESDQKKRMAMEEKRKNAVGSVLSGESDKEEGIELRDSSDEKSISTAKEQAKKGMMGCC